MSTVAADVVKGMDRRLPVEWINQAEFGRRMACTRQNINKLVKKGVLQLVDGKLDFMASKLSYESEVDPSHHERLNKGFGDTGDQGADEVEPTSFKDARAKRERHNADIAEITLLERSGKLIDAEKVKKDAFTTGRILRDSIMAISDRLAPILAAEQSERAVAEILDEELTKALTGVADMTAKMTNDSTSE